MDKPRTEKDLEVILIKKCLRDAEEIDDQMRVRLGYPLWWTDGVTAIAERLYNERIGKARLVEGRLYVETVK